MNRFTSVLTIAVLILISVATACDTSKPGVTSISSAPSAEVPEATATAPLVETATATALTESTATPAGDAPSGPRATALALASAVTLVPAQREEPETDNSYQAIFERAWQIVRDNYVRDNFNGVDWEGIGEAYRPKVEAVSSQGELWNLLDALIDELNDDHSRFVRPDQFAAEFDLPAPDELAFRPWPGLTVWPAREDEQLLVWYVCEFGPAASAGLRRGDVVLAVNGESAQSLQTEEGGFDMTAIRSALYGEEDSVTLTVQRGPERDPEEVELRFGAAAGCDGWQYGLLSSSPRIGYVRVPDFGGDADVNILDTIEMMEEEGPLEGLVVDVRHNPGGNADRSIAIFTKGIFGQVGPLRENATQTIYRVRGPVRWNETTPVAVLTDGSSHSAAEYFATAMQQAGRAVLVGMPTAGNTEGITGFSLADGSLIRLAVSTLQLPDGSTLEGTGVVPDIQVPLGAWGLRQEPDVQLRAAYEALVGE